MVVIRAQKISAGAKKNDQSQGFANFSETVVSGSLDTATDTIDLGFNISWLETTKSSSSFSLFLF
jgi:hypothetical protein